MTTFKRGDYVRKRSGSWWEGYIVGHYATEDNPDGIAVQLPIAHGPVQIYPSAALEPCEPRRIVMVTEDGADDKRTQSQGLLPAPEERS